MSDLKENINNELGLIVNFLKAQGRFLNGFGKRFLGWLDFLKILAAKMMYRQRGRFSQTFIGASMAVLSFLTIIFSSTLENIINSSSNSGEGSTYLIMAAENSGADTLVSESPKGETTEYRIVEGDTVSSIALKFKVTIDTIMWENNLKSVDAIKVGQILKILPVTGVKYKVKRGETIYSIAKAYQVDAQNIIDYPFNTFTNDETFALSAGQELIIPEGIKPKEIVLDTRSLARTVAPIPGVVGEGNFMWPTSGAISQRYSWYHRAVDIANRNNPVIVAAQGGTVTSAGWNGGGYGNFVVINHGNGYTTLYAHMLNNSVVVSAGQVVKQGQKLGIMGSTGRSTGTHLHFEIRSGSNLVDPLGVLR